MLLLSFIARFINHMQKTFGVAHKIFAQIGSTRLNYFQVQPSQTSGSTSVDGLRPDRVLVQKDFPNGNRSDGAKKIHG